MRLFHFRYFAAGAVIAAAAVGAQAQDKPAPPPPGLQQIDEGDQPAITIRRPETESKITEKREGGTVTEIKVNTGRSTYYIRPNESLGNTMSGDAQSPKVRPVEWKVHEFDFGLPKQDNEGRPEPVPATPAPAAAPAKAN